MKKLILITLILFSFTTFAQKSELLGYVPLRTYHYDRTEETQSKYHPTEGGNVGLIFVLRTDKPKHFTEYNFGVMKNSFGDPIFVFQYGVGKRIKDFSLSLNSGIAFNYGAYYEKVDDSKKIPKIFRDTESVPTVVFVVSYNKYKLKPTILVSPFYINGGVTFKI